MPTFTYYTNGLKNNDTFIGPTMTTTAKDTDTVGTYDINISGGAPSNASYIIRYQSGTLSVVEEEEKAETHNDDGKSGAGGNSGTGGNSHKGQTTRNKSKPSYSKSKAGNTASNKSKDSKSDTAQNSDGQKSIQSSFIPSERGIIIIDNLLFIFIIMLLFIVIFFRRKKKDNDED
jgi:cobalamin biosynthesis Mg chelatase CobN